MPQYDTFYHTLDPLTNQLTRNRLKSVHVVFVSFPSCGQHRRFDNINPYASGHLMGGAANESVIAPLVGASAIDVSTGFILKIPEISVNEPLSFTKSHPMRTTLS